MSDPSRKTPIIVGVGDFVNRSKKVEDAIEPLHLIVSALQNALKDTGLSSEQMVSLQSHIDSIDVTATWTWPYHDLPQSIASALRVKPLHTHYSDHGGNQPTKLTDDAARRVSMGESKVALVAGGEALASCLGAKHSIGNPIHIYPLYENSFRAHRNQTATENNAESAKMYGDFAKVAETHPSAWNSRAPAETERSIGTSVRLANPADPLLMNAFNTVNLAAACILTSTEYARELGIPQDRWIYPLGGAGTADDNDFWKRPCFWWSPSISKSLDAAIEVSSLDREAIDMFDFYSCFPIVPKLACEHLGIPIDNPTKPITLLGGLTSFGGAGNNYSMHAINEMVRRLRTGTEKTGLVLANGGWISYEHAICLSRSPRSDGLPYPDANPLPPYVTDVQVPKIAETAEGEALIETYTVEFARDGLPKRGHVVGRLIKNGHRFLANHADERALKELCRSDLEQIGRKGFVKPADDGRNLFAFGDVSRL